MGKYGLSDFLCGRKNPIELADSAKPEADLQTLLWLILQKIQTIILPNNKSLNADFFCQHGFAKCSTFIGDDLLPPGPTSLGCIASKKLKYLYMF